jgi:hypothetical protein
MDPHFSMAEVAVICDFDRVSRRIPVRHPIGLMVDEEKKELYIASPAKDKEG